MRLLFCIGHPSQYYLFSKIIYELQKRKHEVILLFTPKDVLEDLVKQSNIPYQKLESIRTSNSKINQLNTIIKRYSEIFHILKLYKPNLLIGTEITLPILGKIFKIPSLTFCEDDANLLPIYGFLAYNFTNSILSPISSNAGRWEKKKIGYDGYQKLAYLHPNQFSPLKSIIDKYLGKRFFLLRFVSLEAYHDQKVNGIDVSLAQKLIDKLTTYGEIYISSEKELMPQFEKYRLQINPSDIHSVLSCADLFIGDSQSMAVEAALLGIPGIRFNDFAGRVGVLEELEHKYNLTFGYRTNQEELLFHKVEELLTKPGIMGIFKKRREVMLDDKIDVTSFLVWFIDNYPESNLIMKANPQFQYKFK